MGAVTIPQVGAIVVNHIGLPTAKQRFLALQGCQFTDAVRREAELLDHELRDDGSPEVMAMRAVICEARRQTDEIRAIEAEREAELLKQILRW